MENDRAALWTFAGVAIAFKLFAALLILSFDPSAQAIAIVVATSWPVFLPLLLLIPPAIWWFRLIRIRMRRQQLLEAEWKQHEPTEAANPER